MSNTDFSKIKGQTPISVVVHGGNYTGYMLAKTLLEQGSQVIIIDKYNSESKSYFSELKKEGKVNFIDFKGLKSFLEKIARIDYLYYLLEERLENNENFESKDFLAESDYLNNCLITAQKYKAKVALITSLRLNRELSNKINNENVSQPSPYSNLELQRYCENFVAEFTDKTKANTRIIRLGTLFGKGIKELRDKTLDKLFVDASKKSQIEILGEGLEIHNIINESDAIYGILKLTFSDKSKGDVVTLANENDYTTLSLAYKLLELDVEAKAIKFVEKTGINPVIQDLYVPAPHASEYGWNQNVNLENSIVEQLQAYYESSEKRWNIGKKAIKEERPLTSTKETPFGEFFSKLFSPFKSLFGSKKMIGEIGYTGILKAVALFSVSLLALYFLIAPLIGVGIGSYLIFRSTETLKSEVAEMDFESINIEALKIGNNLERVDNNLSQLYWLFELTGNRDSYNGAVQLIQGTEYALESAQDLTGGLMPLGLYMKDFEPAVSFGTDGTSTSREYREYLEMIDDNQSNIKEGIYKISLAESLISSVSTKDMPRFVQDFVLEYKDLISMVSNSVSSLEEISQFLPDLLGVEERKRYLILLQNEGEIRSTGGWITSYAVVGIEGGQIRELFVDDIYNADGTLKVQGHTYKTPSSMIKALEDTPYSFSVVNWDANLDSVMINSEQFIYDLGKGDDLDGVFTIDTVFLQKLLDKWGGIEVPGESEIITSENLHSKIFEMHNDFTPGSNRKSSFLANLANESITKIFASDFNDYKDIADVIVESLNEKHVQATFKNTLARSYFDDNNWDGNIDSKYLTAPVDIDWNWGANKANMFIKKNHTLEIDIKDDKAVDYSYQIAIENNSTKDTYPEGEYVNYVRIYIPQNAEVLGISGLENNEYDLYSEGGYKIIGGWFNIPIKETSTLDISYRVSDNENSNYFPLDIKDSNVSLDLNIYKQPGSKKDAYNLTVKYPNDWTLGSSDSLSVIGSELNSRFDLATDQNFNITWEK